VARSEGAGGLTYTKQCRRYPGQTCISDSLGLSAIQFLDLLYVRQMESGTVPFAQRRYVAPMPDTQLSLDEDSRITCPRTCMKRILWAVHDVSSLALRRFVSKPSSSLLVWRERTMANHSHVEQHRNSTFRQYGRLRPAHVRNSSSEGSK